MTLTEWAASYAEGLLAPLGDRWAHVQSVVRQAQQVAAILPAEEREVLEAMQPQVAESGAVWKLIGDQFGRGRRQQHLPPWPTAMILAVRLTTGPK